MPDFAGALWLAAAEEDDGEEEEEDDDDDEVGEEGTGVWECVGDGAVCTTSASSFVFASISSPFPFPFAAAFFLGGMVISLCLVLVVPTGIF